MGQFAAASADSLDGARLAVATTFFILGFSPSFGAIVLVLFAHAQRQKGRILNSRHKDDVYPVKWTESLITRQVSILKWGIPCWVLIVFSLVVREDFFHVVEFLSMVGWVCWAYLWQISWVEKRQRNGVSEALRRAYRLSRYAAFAGTALYTLRWLIDLNFE